MYVVICLKISTFVVSTTTVRPLCDIHPWLWFAWKYLPLWYQQQHNAQGKRSSLVVICLKISTFVVSTTTQHQNYPPLMVLWFAWKYLPLWYQQQPAISRGTFLSSCDLLENIYLCGINNNYVSWNLHHQRVVICLKISTFVVSTTTRANPSTAASCCDLLENIYLCGINNNIKP